MAVDTSAFEAKRRTVNDQYARQTANNAYARFLSQQRGDRGIADFRQDFSRKAPKFTASFGQRGLTGGGVRSGSYQRALQNYLGDYTRDLGRAHEDQQQSLRQYDLNDADYATARNSALADIEMEKARQIAMTAENLRALAPYLQ